MPHEKENLEVSRYDKIQINSWKIHQEANELISFRLLFNE